MKLPPKQVKPPKRTGRLKCPAHLRWIRTFHCVVPGCFTVPVEACHCRSGTDGAMGRKPSDHWTFPACAHHHQEQHRLGEASFEEKYTLDLKEICRGFLQASPHKRRFIEAGEEFSWRDETYAKEEWPGTGASG